MIVVIRSGLAGGREQGGMSSGIHLRLPAANPRPILAFRKIYHMRISGIHHVAVICSDYTRSKRFYSEVMGFKIISETYRRHVVSRARFGRFWRVADRTVFISGFVAAPLLS